MDIIEKIDKSAIRLLELVLREVKDKPIKENKKDGRKDTEIEQLLKPENKGKTIVEIIDKLPKFSDKLREQLEQITVKMEGFDRIHLEAYQKHLLDYKRFLDEYLRGEAYNPIISMYSYSASNEEKPVFKWGDEVIDYHKRIEVVRKLQMNSMMCNDLSGAGPNHVDPQDRQDYEMWKYMSKFNLSMSFLMYESVGKGG